MTPKQRLIEIAIHGGAMMGSPTDLARGAYTGKETFLYRNSGTYAVPVWDEIPRARNIQITDGPALSDVEYHGAAFTSQVPGYNQFNGSIEYVRRRGVDAIFDDIKAASEGGLIEDWQHLNGDIAIDGSAGWRSPIIIGEFSSTANGGDVVVETIPVSHADAYDSGNVVVTKVPVVISGGAALQGPEQIKAVMAATKDTYRPKRRASKEHIEAVKKALADFNAKANQAA